MLGEDAARSVQGWEQLLAQPGICLAQPGLVLAAQQGATG